MMAVPPFFLRIISFLRSFLCPIAGNNGGINIQSEIIDVQIMKKPTKK